ncbi:unnamed protein product [Clonostachys rosea f. rosea IK726]|uniref:Uncharacterized protein n=1 Tax=Clonostachys rosea f. rosea IK726 TaxID=1349383 RepID=A0ACA9TVV7_BIOOC|nr:unnamed protein product [Clonostachys rosea f. rosea IK726]
MPKKNGRCKRIPRYSLEVTSKQIPNKIHRFVDWFLLFRLSASRDIERILDTERIIFSVIIQDLMQIFAVGQPSTHADEPSQRKIQIKQANSGHCHALAETPEKNIMCRDFAHLYTKQLKHLVKRLLQTLKLGILPIGWIIQRRNVKPLR